jgi:hypothetical protein
MTGGGPVDREVLAYRPAGRPRSHLKFALIVGLLGAFVLGSVGVLLLLFIGWLL